MSFLRVTTLATAWTVAAALAQPKKLGVGVVGCGRIGRVHLATLAKLPSAEVKIVADYFLDAAKSAAETYGVAEAVQEAEEVIAHPEVDAVWICSPSAFHAPQIRLAAEQGKDVFCEKPLGVDLAESAAVVRFAEEKGIKLMTAFQRRFDANFQRLRKAIETEEVGKPVQLRLVSRDPSPPPLDYVKGGGGIFMDMAVHDLDMACFLLGQEPKRCLAVGSCQIDKAIEDLPGAEAFDTANVLLEFDSGVVASIDVCRQAPYGYDQRFEFLGTKGLMSSENVHPNTVRKQTGVFSGTADLALDFFMNRYEEAYEGETVAFAEAVGQGDAVPCDGWAGVRGLRLAMVAEKSALENRWVDLDEIPIPE